MRVDPRLGTFEAVRDAAPGHAATLDAIRALVMAAHPDVHETASTRERSVWWGWGPRKMADGYAWAMPHRDHVNFGFFRGAVLPDPEGVLEGTGKALRHMKLRGPDDVGSPAVRALLDAAREDRRPPTVKRG
jgi:hypothetical protein